MSGWLRVSGSLNSSTGELPENLPSGSLIPGRVLCIARLLQPNREPKMSLKAVVLTLALVAVTGE